MSLGTQSEHCGPAKAGWRSVEKQELLDDLMGVELCLCLVWPSQTSSTAAAAASTAPAFYPLSSPQHTTSISRPCDPGPEPNALETDKQREGGESAETLLSIIN